NTVTIPNEGTIFTGNITNTAVYAVGADPTGEAEGIESVAVTTPGLESNSFNLAMLEPGLTSDIEVEGVDSVSGRYVFSTTSDLLGQNVGGNRQLYLADAKGNVLAQITSAAGNN